MSIHLSDVQLDPWGWMSNRNLYTHRRRSTDLCIWLCSVPQHSHSIFAQIAVALNDCGRPGNVWKLGFWWILWRCAETAEQMKHFWNGNTFCYRVEASKVRVTLSPLIIRIPQTLEQLFLAFSSYRRCCQQTMRLLKLLMTRSVPIRSRHFVYTITEGNPQACPFRPINKTIATKMRDAVFGTDLQ